MTVVRHLTFSASLALAGCPTTGEPASDSATDTGDDTFVGTVPDPLPGGGSQDLRGDLTCGAPQSVLFDGEAGEVIAVATTFEQGGDSVSGSNPSVTLRYAGTPVARDGNDVGAGGAVYVNEPFTGEFLLNLTETGPHELWYEVAECEPVHFETTLTRVRVASDNRSRAEATPLTDGVAVPGVFGCVEERWYTLDLAADERVRLDFGGVSIVGSDDGVFREGGGTLDLLDAAGEPVIAYGNPVAVVHTFTGVQGETSVEVDVPAGHPCADARCLLRATWWNGCTIADFYVRYHTL
jgi:hypothetical protein